MAGELNMAASELLAGAKLLSRKLSDEEQRDADRAVREAWQRDYEAWISSLPISKADQDLVRIIDRMRRRLVAGHDIGKRLKSALVVFGNRTRRESQKFSIRGGVDYLHKSKQMPKTVDATTGPGAFEEAGKLFAYGPPLSAEQVRKIYYEKKKLPGKKKTRP
jgi:hypothetical protein